MLLLICCLVSDKNITCGIRVIHYLKACATKYHVELRISDCKRKENVIFLSQTDTYRMWKKRVNYDDSHKSKNVRLTTTNFFFILEDFIASYKIF